MKASKLVVSLFALSVSIVASDAVHATDAAPDTAPDPSAGPAASITVSGHADKPTLDRHVTAGILGAKSALDTPFTVSAVSSDDIQNLQTKDINGAFRDDASITEVNSSLAQASGASVRVRGVALDQLNSVKIDGLAIPWWSIDLPIEQFDQVQLFKGATGFMYGFGSPAGVLNYVTRRPGDGFIFNADTGWRSSSLFSGHVDIGDRSRDGRFGWRLNVQGETGTVYNGGTNHNISADLALEYRLTDALTWTADGFYMDTHQKDEVNTVSVGAAVTNLATVSGSTNFGAQGDWKTNQMGVATTALDWQIAPNWTARLSYRWSRLDENFPGNLVTITDNAGDYTASAFFIRRLFKYNQVQALVQGKLQTGPIAHDLTFGAEFEDQGQFSDQNGLVTHALGSGNIYTNLNITLGQYPASNYNPILYELNHYIQKSLFAADTATLGRFSLLLGLRYTNYQDTSGGPGGTVVAVYNANPVSPTVALTYKLDEATRIYVSYVGGLQNGGAAGSTNVNNSQTYGPIRTRQYEAGIKTDHAIWHAALALFRTSQDADYVTTANYYVQSGTALYQGVELSGAVKPAREWSLSASASYLDSELQNEGPVYSGKEIAGVPDFQLAGGIDYQPQFLPGLRLNADAKYTDSGYGNTLNTLKFPSYTTVNLAAAYGFDVGGHHVVARVGVKNVGNERYWIYGSSTVIPGEPRTVVAGLHFGW
jgi:iron complex outermembrane recepter protein